MRVPLPHSAPPPQHGKAGAPWRGALTPLCTPHLIAEKPTPLGEEPLPHAAPPPHRGKARAPWRGALLLFFLRLLLFFLPSAAEHSERTEELWILALSKSDSSRSSSSLCREGGWVAGLGVAGPGSSKDTLWLCSVPNQVRNLCLCTTYGPPSSELLLSSPLMPPQLCSTRFPQAVTSDCLTPTYSSKVTLTTPSSRESPQISLSGQVWRINGSLGAELVCHI